MFVKDSMAEQWLTANGVSWKYTNSVRWTDLVPGWQDRNAGRETPKRREAIETCLARWNTGSIPPAPILRKTDAGLEVTDGIQRLTAAHERELTSMSGYIYTTDNDALAHLMRVTANFALSGYPEPPEWTKRKVVSELIIGMGMSVEEVSHKLGLPVKDLSDEKTAQEWGFKIRCAGVLNDLHKGFLLEVASHFEESDLAFEPVKAFLREAPKLFTNGQAKPHIAAFAKINRANPKRVHDQFERKWDLFDRDPEVIYARQHGKRRDKCGPGRGVIEKGILVIEGCKSLETRVRNAIEAGASVPDVDQCFQILARVRTGIQKLAANKPEKVRK